MKITNPPKLGPEIQSTTNAPAKPPSSASVARAHSIDSFVGGVTKPPAAQPPKSAPLAATANPQEAKGLIETIASLISGLLSALASLLGSSNNTTPQTTTGVQSSQTQPKNTTTAQTATTTQPLTTTKPTVTTQPLTTKPAVTTQPATTTQTVSNAQAANATLQNVLGADVAKVAAKSPILQEDLGKLLSEGWRISYGPSGGGSCADRNAKTITLDSALKGNTNQIVQVLAHEVGHASNDLKIDYSSRQAYLNGTLSDEGAATLKNIEVRKQILANGGPDIGVGGTQSQQYIEIYNRLGNTPKAQAEIGNIFATKERTSTTGQTYGDYYASYYDKNPAMDQWLRDNGLRK